MRRSPIPYRRRLLLLTSSVTITAKLSFCAKIRDANSPVNLVSITAAAASTVKQPSLLLQYGHHYHRGYRYGLSAISEDDLTRR